ncbi:MAG: tetratricopeptide repeat protein, partial [Actinobacteria bacterium]|nr:tetratricopeptide repeat protein [Actinomycetota bacterium]
MRNGNGGDGLDDGGLEPLPEGFDPHAVDINEASEDLLWKVLPLMEGNRKAEALYVLGSRLARNDRWEQAVVCAEESAQEWEKLDNSTGMVTGLLAAATCRSHLADYDAAIEHYLRVISLLR